MEILVVGFWLICGVGAAMIASSKNRSGCIWFGLGVLLGPIALLVVGFMAPAPAPMAASAPDSIEETKKCPYCAETIKSEAKLCRFCGKELPVEVSDPPRAESIRQMTIDEFNTIGTNQQTIVMMYGYLLSAEDAEKASEMINGPESGSVLDFVRSRGERVAYPK